MPDLIAVPNGPKSGPWRSALLGLILGVDAAGLCLALATLCFGGQLASGLGFATGLFLLGSAVATITLYYFSGFKLSLAISQDTTISILAPAIVIATAAVAGSAEAKVATALAVIGCSAVASGIVFWGIGRLGLGRLVRMFPYPVAAGFLASSGYLLVYSAISILTDQSSFAGITQAAFDPLIQLRLFPALAMAIALVVAMHIWSGSSSVLAMIFIFLLGFYAVTYSFGVDLAAGVELGLLPRVGVAADGHASFAMFGMIDWWAVLGASPVILAVVLLNLIGMLLNTSGVELATRSDVDENRELRVTGATNILIGAFGGLTSYLQGGATIIAYKLGVERRALILGHVFTLLVACVLAPIMVAVVPTFVPAALLLFIGLSMLEDWLLGTRKRLTKVDWLIVLSIVLATAFIGILPAIGIGIALALLGFAFALIRLPIIRHATNAAKRRSIRDRSTLQNEALQREGHRIRILHLQGPLFFGSVEQITANLRSLVQLDPNTDAIIIDCAEVHSFDSSACAALDKLAYIINAHKIDSHITGVSPGLLTVFQQWGLALAKGSEILATPAFRLWPSLDEALEHCETTLLSELGLGDVQEDIVQTLFELGRQHPRSADLLALMKKRKLKSGEILIQAAEKAADVYFLISGQLGVHLPSSTGPGVRVRSLGQGAIVGEIAYLTGQKRIANVISEGESEVLFLSEVTIRQVERDDRDLAALIMSIFSRSLAAKLANSNSRITSSQIAIESPVRQTPK